MWAEFEFSPMLDPVREAQLAQYMRQFREDALSGLRPAAEAALTEAAAVVHSVLAGAAHRWNAALPAMQLPAKCLAAIFGCLSLQDRMHVARVCRSWRRSALAEPRLWNRISLKDRHHDPLYDSDVIPWYNSNFVHGVLARSAGVLVDLTVYELRSGPYANAFLNALPGVMSSLRSLRVDFSLMDPDIDRLMDVLSAPAPFLEHLTLHNLSSWWSGLNGHGIGPPFCAPRLRSVSITGVALSSSLDPLPSVSKVTVDLGRNSSRVSPTSWTRNLFALFPNAVEVSLPDFGGCFDFPAAPSASHVIQSLTLGHEGANNPQSYIPLHWHLAKIAFINLRWPAHKTARDFLAETFGTAIPRVLTITGYGTRIALSAGALRRQCDPAAKDLARLLADPAVFATVTDLTLVDRCAPDPVWKLVSALPALVQLTILVAQCSLQQLLTRADSTRRGQAPAARHPTLETVIFREDPEWDTSKNVPKGPYPPTVFAPQAERVLRARVGLVVAPDGSSSPRVVSRGVLIENTDQAALNIVIEEVYRIPAL